MLLAGGTGGHIFPAIALAKSLADLGAKTVFVGRRASIEERLVKTQPFPFYPLPASGFFGKGLAKKIAFFFNLGRGFIGSLTLLSKIKPHAIVATGSFTSLAPLLAAIILKKRFFLLEQNRIPGRLTRYLAGFACKTYLNFPVEKHLSGPTAVAGNPLRPEIVKTVRTTDGKTVLFLGGSQGAHRLNVAAIETSARLPHLHFIVQTGERDYEFMRQNLSPNCQAVAFTTAPEDFYSRADLVVSRAGATALAEILCLGLPAILIPFPFATDQHQLANARYVAAAGAAVVLTEDRIGELPALIKNLMADTLNRNIMSKNAKKLARPDSARVIARSVSECSAA